MIGGKWLISLVLIALCFSAGAQDIRFIASADDVVETGTRFYLKYNLNAEGENFRGPSIKGFNVLSGPQSSTSSSIQIINGQVSKSIDVTYTYILEATTEGTYTIPPASVEVDGKTFKSNSLTIQVIRGRGRQQPSQRSGSSRSGDNTPSKEEVFLKAFADKKNPLQGEQVIVTYRIYTKVPISHIDIEKLASFPGFWSKNLLRENEQLRQSTEIVNGEEYVVADVRKVALFPQKSGKLTIEPLEMQCVAQVRQQSKRRSGDPFFDNFFNDPFFNRYQNVELTVKSNSLSLDVRPLPTQNKPGDFSGTVGDFTFRADINKEQLKTNEAVNFKVTIAGKGNIELVETPSISFPPDFEVYDPKVTMNVSATPQGVSGQKTFDYLIIPRQHGTFKIQPVRFSYFDLSSKRYKTLTSPEFTLTVEKGEATDQPVTYSGVNQEDVKYLGTDIRYIKTGVPELHVKGRYFFGSTGFWILLIAPVVLFIAALIIWKKELKKRSDMAIIRNRKATKVARRRLTRAYSLMKQNDEEKFFIEISQALWGYLSDKLSIPLSQLSLDTVSETLDRENVGKDTQEIYLETVQKTEFERFAPGGRDNSMEKVYDMAVQAITRMEKELKKMI